MTAAGYNRFHDQLLLSASTDGAVKLWRAASISSAPPAEYELDGALGDDGDGDADGLVKEYAFGRVSDTEGASHARSRTPLTPLLPPQLSSVRAELERETATQTHVDREAQEAEINLNRERAATEHWRAQHERETEAHDSVQV